MHIIDALKNFAKKKPVLFTTPGHSQENIAIPEFLELAGKKLLKSDVSEVSGFDNLQNPEGIILKSQIRASEAYGSKLSYYLVNGATSGIIALMMATVNQGDKVLIARNAHKSVINALILSGATPVWINTDWIDEWNIPGPLNYKKVDEAIRNNPDIKAVWLTSPTYEGVVTKIEPIVRLCREKGIFLIVDEAHGALWNFGYQLPTPAIHLGADASVQSLHKTASALTQGAILHLSNDSRVDPRKLQQCLNLINTTSPSYILLASIENAVEYLRSKEGKKRIDNLIKSTEKFRNKLSKYEGINVLKKNNNYNIDPTKLFIGISGISGSQLGDILLEKYNTEVELENNTGVLALTGIGTSDKKINDLARSIINIKKSTENDPNYSSFVTPLIEPKVIFRPREAFFKKSRIIDIQDSLGLISKETIVPYPPGIPVLIAGEVIQQQHIELLKDRKQIQIALD